jgi:ribosomal protein S17E
VFCGQLALMMVHRTINLIFGSNNLTYQIERAHGDKVMTNEYLDSFDGFGKSAIEATKELVEIIGRLMSKMLENQISVANMFIESGEKQVSSADANKDPKDFVASQTALIEEYAAKLTEAAQANTKLAQEAGEALKSWFEKGVKTADEAVKNAAKTAAPATAVSRPAAAKPAPAKKGAPKKSSAKKTSAKTAANKAPTKKAAA